MSKKDIITWERTTGITMAEVVYPRFRIWKAVRDYNEWLRDTHFCPECGAEARLAPRTITIGDHEELEAVGICDCGWSEW